MVVKSIQTDREDQEKNIEQAQNEENQHLPKYISYHISKTFSIAFLASMTFLSWSYIVGSRNI